MSELRCQVDFSEKPFTAKSGSEHRVEDLYRHLALRVAFLGQEHGAHSPTAELALDRVPIGEGCLELFLKIAQSLEFQSRKITSAVLIQGRYHVVALAATSLSIV